MSLFNFGRSKNYDQLFNAGMRQYLLKNYEKAINLFSKAIEKKPKKEKAYYQRGMAFARIGNILNAIQDFKKVFNMKPTGLEKEVCYSLGKAYDELQQYDKSLNWYDKCVHYGPKFSNAYANRASVHCRFAEKTSSRDEFKLALADANRALKLNPKDPFAYYTRAIVNKALNNKEDIEADLQKFLKYAPANHPYIPQVKKFISSLEKRPSSKVERVRAKKQKKLFEEIIEKNNQDQFEKANELCDAFLEERRDIPAIWDEKAFALWNLGHPEEALKICNEGIGVNPNEARLFHKKGDLLLELKRYHEAIGAYEKYLAIAPKEYEPLFEQVINNIQFAKQKLQ